MREDFEKEGLLSENRINVLFSEYALYFKEHGADIIEAYIKTYTYWSQQLLDSFSIDLYKTTKLSAQLRQELYKSIAEYYIENRSLKTVINDLIGGRLLKKDGTIGDSKVIKKRGLKHFTLEEQQRLWAYILEKLNSDGIPKNRKVDAFFFDLVDNEFLAHEQEKKLRLKDFFLCDFDSKWNALVQGYYVDNEKTNALIAFANGINYEGNNGFFNFQIIGERGIGKTTLAMMMSLELLVNEDRVGWIYCNRDRRILNDDEFTGLVNILSKNRSLKYLVIDEPEALSEFQRSQLYEFLQKKMKRLRGVIWANEKESDFDNSQTFRLNLKNRTEFNERLKSLIQNSCGIQDINKAFTTVWQKQIQKYIGTYTPLELTFTLLRWDNPNSNLLDTMYRRQLNDLKENENLRPIYCSLWIVYYCKVKLNFHVSIESFYLFLGWYGASNGKVTSIANEIEGGLINNTPSVTRFVYSISSGGRKVVKFKDYALFNCLNRFLESSDLVDESLFQEFFMQRIDWTSLSNYSAAQLIYRINEHFEALRISHDSLDWESIIKGQIERKNSDPSYMYALSKSFEYFQGEGIDFEDLGARFLEFAPESKSFISKYYLPYFRFRNLNSQERYRFLEGLQERIGVGVNETLDLHYYRKLRISKPENKVKLIGAAFLSPFPAVRVVCLREAQQEIQAGAWRTYHHSEKDFLSIAKSDSRRKDIRNNKNPLIDDSIDESVQLEYLKLLYSGMKDFERDYVADHYLVSLVVDEERSLPIQLFAIEKIRKESMRERACYLIAEKCFKNGLIGKFKQQILIRCLELEKDIFQAYRNEIISFIENRYFHNGSKILDTTKYRDLKLALLKLAWGDIYKESQIIDGYKTLLRIDQLKVLITTFNNDRIPIYVLRKIADQEGDSSDTVKVLACHLIVEHVKSGCDFKVVKEEVVFEALRYLSLDYGIVVTNIVCHSEIETAISNLLGDEALLSASSKSKIAIRCKRFLSDKSFASRYPQWRKQNEIRKN